MAWAALYMGLFGTDLPECSSGVVGYKSTGLYIDATERALSSFLRRGLVSSSHGGKNIVSAHIRLFEAVMASLNLRVPFWAGLSTYLSICVTPFASPASDSYPLPPISSSTEIYRMTTSWLKAPSH